MASATLARRRTKRIFASLDGRRNQPDAILLRNGVEPHIDLTFFYVTAIPSGIFEGSTAALLPDGETHVLASALEEESARQAKTGFRLHVPTKKAKDGEVLQSILGRRKMTVGINAPELTWRDYKSLKKALPKARFVDVSEGILRARMIKDAEEVDAIERAARISSKVADEIPKWLKPGVTEAELAAEIDYRQRRAGGQGPSFSTIAAFGRNAAEPHYTELGSRLKRGQFALFDFGTRFRRYCSDITRTFFVGRPKPKDRRMYETVLAAQEAAFEVLGPGVRGALVHKAAEKVIDAGPFRGTFIHGLGHGLGLAVHDGGGLSIQSRLVLKPGMVVTVEPGVYLRAYGGVRIEDDVLITKRGYRRLTTARREFRTVG